jgi:XapX domain-containing protein
MIKIALGVVVGLAIGAGCRWFDVPVPSPPSIVGALLVVAMTIGYIGMDAVLTSRDPGKTASTRSWCGGQDVVVSHGKDTETG